MALGLPPDGYWYIIAYEATAAGSPTTWGSASSPITWQKFLYFQPKPIYGSDAAGVALGAALQHRQTSQKGAVRAYWWDNQQWVLQPLLNQDWGTTLGLRDAATAEPPAPATLPAPTATAATPPAAAPGGAAPTLLWIGLVGAAALMVYGATRPPKRRR